MVSTNGLINYRICGCLCVCVCIAQPNWQRAKGVCPIWGWMLIPPTSKPSQKLELAIPQCTRRAGNGFRVQKNGWDSFIIGCTNKSFESRQFTFQIQRKANKAPSKRGKGITKRERERERERERTQEVGARRTKNPK